MVVARLGVSLLALVLVTACGLDFSTRQAAAAASCRPLAVVAATTGLREQDVYVLNLDGGTKALTNDKRSFGPAVGPDGKWMVITRGAKGSFSELTGYDKTSLEIIDRKGKRISKFPTEDGWNDANAAVSPDGSRIAFIRSSGDRTKLMVMAKSGKRQRVLRSDLGSIPQTQVMAWSPDGRSLAVVTRTPESPHLLIIDTGDGRVASDTPASSNWSHLAWSPDSTRILLSNTRYETGESVKEVVMATGVVTDIGRPTAGSWTNATYAPNDREAYVLRYQPQNGPSFIPQQIERISLSGAVLNSGVADSRLLIGGLSVNDCS